MRTLSCYAVEWVSDKFLAMMKLKMSQISQPGHYYPQHKTPLSQTGEGFFTPLYFAKKCGSGKSEYGDGSRKS